MCQVLKGLLHLVKKITDCQNDNTYMYINKNVKSPIILFKIQMQYLFIIVLITYDILPWSFSVSSMAGSSNTSSILDVEEMEQIMEFPWPWWHSD